MSSLNGKKSNYRGRKQDQCRESYGINVEHYLIHKVNCLIPFQNFAKGCIKIGSRILGESHSTFHKFTASRNWHIWQPPISFLWDDIFMWQKWKIGFLNPNTFVAEYVDLIYSGKIFNVNLHSQESFKSHFALTGAKFRENVAEQWRFGKVTLTSAMVPHFQIFEGVGTIVLKEGIWC